MALPGECINATHAVCCECQAVLDIEVLSSAAGYYIGFLCPNCGPYSRASGYYRSREDAQHALDSEFYGR